ncbi:MAG: ABC transporter ATP-binding protein [Clostridiales bacterium]|nr:ABC transporter ATP-binding protein [Clostridiales bacterium]
MSTGNNELLSVKNLQVVYTSDGVPIHAVNGVTFSLEKGKTLGLVGETGAGKTSIAKAILGVLPEFSTKSCAGEICFQGTDLLSLKERQMAEMRGRDIAMIFQDPMTALNPVMTVGDQIAEGIRIHNKVGKKKAREMAEAMLEMVGIPAGRYKDYPHQFSGGMKQRVVIAIALSCRPTLLLADEPTTALDVTIQAQVLEMIVKLRDEMGMSMIMITHDLGVVAEVCDYVAVVYAGEVVEYGTLSEIYHNPAHPYTQGLFGALPDISVETERLHSIQGMPPDPSHLPEGCKFAPRCPHATDACRSGEVGLENCGGTHTCRCLRAKEEG